MTSRQSGAHRHCRLMVPLVSIEKIPGSLECTFSANCVEETCRDDCVWFRIEDATSFCQFYSRGNCCVGHLVQRQVSPLTAHVQLFKQGDLSGVAARTFKRRGFCGTHVTLLRIRIWQRPHLPRCSHSLHGSVIVLIAPTLRRRTRPAAPNPLLDPIDSPFFVVQWRIQILPWLI